MLDEGLNQSETARRLTVARQTVSEWLRQYRAQGEAGLRKAGRAGRKPLLDATQLERLEILLLKGPEAHGFPTPLWTCPRVARLIRDEFGVRYHEGHVWKILRALRWSPQRPVGKARERNEEAIRDWKCKRWPAIKNARKQDRTIVFIDESGLSQSRIVAAPSCWSSTSIGRSFRCRLGLTLRNFYFRLYPGAIGELEVIDFLKAWFATLTAR